MMVTCWDEKVSARHQIESVIKCLAEAAKVWVADVPAFCLASETGISQVMGLKGEEAQSFVDESYKVSLFGLQAFIVYADVQGVDFGLDRDQFTIWEDIPCPVESIV
jgi:hypothetical protein